MGHRGIPTSSRPSSRGRRSPARRFGGSPGRDRSSRRCRSSTRLVRSAGPARRWASRPFTSSDSNRTMAARSLVPKSHGKAWSQECSGAEPSGARRHHHERVVAPQGGGSTPSRQRLSACASGPPAARRRYAAPRRPRRAGPQRPSNPSDNTARAGSNAGTALPDGEPVEVLGLAGANDGDPVSGVLDLRSGSSGTSLSGYGEHGGQVAITPMIHTAVASRTDVARGASRHRRRAGRPSSTARRFARRPAGARTRRRPERIQ